MPSSSARCILSRRYAFRASARRSDRYSASMSKAVSRSRSGCWRARPSSSPTSSAASPPPEIGVDAELDGLQAQLLEPGDLGLGERLVGEVLVRAAAPERQRLADHDRRRRRVAVDEQPALLEQLLEPPGVDVLRPHLEEVAGRAGEQERALRPPLPLGFERRTQAGDVHPQRALLVGAARAVPQLVQDPIGRQHRPGVGQQEAEERPLAVGAEAQRLAVALDLQATQCSILDAHPSPRSPP